jgi:hypothetical protein
MNTHGVEREAFITRLFLGESSGVLAGALPLVEASIGFRRGIKASGMWLPRECYSPLLWHPELRQGTSCLLRRSWRVYRRQGCGSWPWGARRGHWDLQGGCRRSQSFRREGQGDWRRGPQEGRQPQVPWLPAWLHLTRWSSKPWLLQARRQRPRSWHWLCCCHLPWYHRRSSVCRQRQLYSCAGVGWKDCSRYCRCSKHS